MVQSSNLTLSFSLESSIEEKLKRESTTDVVTIVVSHCENFYSHWPFYLKFDWSLVFILLSIWPFASQASYLIMFAYISMAMGDTPCLSSFYISSKV